MNRLSWDTTAPRRPKRMREPRPDDRGFEPAADLLRPAWDELRRLRF